MTTHVLLATNGHSDSLGAVRYARSLEESVGARIEALGIVEPSLLTSGTSEPARWVDPPAASRIADAVQARIRGQLKSVSDRAEVWPLTLRTGGVAPTIAKVAAELSVDFILVGLSGEEGLDGYFSREMIVRLTHLVDIPIIAIPATSTGLRTAVAAIDASPLSARAAKTSLTILPPDATLHLAHAIKSGPSDQEGAAQARLREVTSMLQESKSSRLIQTHLLFGEPSGEILKLVREVEADLVVAGSRGAGLVSRAVLGGVAERLVHTTPCAIMIVPRKRGEDLGIDLTDEELVRNLGRAGELV